MGTERDMRAEGGFSLVELISVVAIMGILVAVAVASFWISIDRSRRVTCLHNQRLMDSALMQYQLDNDGLFPAVDDFAGLELVEQYVVWPDPAYATCAADRTVQFTFDHETGIVRCPTHTR
jgi:prepilin-type N-terminal cleavage/methylation domain-containing protein